MVIKTWHLSEWSLTISFSYIYNPLNSTERHQRYVPVRFAWAYPHCASAIGWALAIECLKHEILLYLILSLKLLYVQNVYIQNTNYHIDIAYKNKNNRVLEAESTSLKSQARPGTEIK